MAKTDCTIQKQFCIAVKYQVHIIATRVTFSLFLNTLAVLVTILFVLVKLEMFLDGFFNIPGAGHSRGKCDKVTLSKSGWFSSIGGCNGDLPLQQVGTLVRVVSPRKLGGLASPGSY